MILRTLLLLLLFSCHWILEAEAGGSYHHRYSSSNNSNDSTAAVVIFVIFLVLFLLLLFGLGWWAWSCPGDPYCYDSSCYYRGPYCSQLGYPHVCDVPACRTTAGPPARHHPSTLDTTHYSYEEDPETGVREQYRNVSF